MAEVIEIFVEKKLKCFPGQRSAFDAHREFAYTMQSFNILFEIVLGFGTDTACVDTLNLVDLFTSFGDCFVANGFAHHAGARLADAAA